MVPSLCVCTFAFFSVSIATMFAHLCLQLRSSTASWCRAYFVSQRADALHWIVHWSCALLRFFSISIATMFVHLVVPRFVSVCWRLMLQKQYLEFCVGGGALMILLFFFVICCCGWVLLCFIFLSFLHISSVFFVCLLCSRWWIFMHQVVKMIMRWWQIMFFGLPETEDAFFGGAEPEECGSERLCFCFACRAQFESPTDFATEVTQWCRALWASVCKSPCGSVCV